MNFINLELLYKQQQTYFFPQPIEIPYYLCIKTSMHIDDIPSLHAKQYRKAHERKHDFVYGEKQLEYEYWFSVPKEKYSIFSFIYSLFFHVYVYLELIIYIHFFFVGHLNVN